MRTHQKLAFLVASTALAAAVATAPSALAAPMDPTPERLYLSPSSYPAGWDCRRIASDPQGFVTANPTLMANGQQATPNSFPCMANNAGWANMMSELAYAIAPSAFHPARTTGFGGFALSLEASFAHINADARDSHGVQYWHDGTQGAVDPSNNRFGSSNSNPDSILQIYTLKARKGLGYGFEITGALGYMANTSLWVGGADLHWAVLEGYRTGVLGYLPDIAIGGGVRTLGGSPSFFLTTVGMDAQVSKPFALADSAVLTPYVGAQRLYVFADSTVVSLTPNVDPLAQCGYEGANVPGNTQYASAPYDGRPLCRNQLQLAGGKTAPNDGDFNNQVTFAKLRAQRWRGIVGVTYRYEVLYLAGQFAMDLEDPGAENNSNAVGDKITGDKQWTVSLEAGVFF